MRTKDDGTPPASSTTVVLVTLLDVNEPPVVDAPRYFQIAEDALGGDVVGTIYASDPDAGQSHEFTLADLDDDNGGGAAAAAAAPSSPSSGLWAGGSAVRAHASPSHVTCRLDAATGRAA